MITALLKKEEFVLSLSKIRGEKVNLSCNLLMIRTSLEIKTGFSLSDLTNQIPKFLLEIISIAHVVISSLLTQVFFFIICTK